MLSILTIVAESLGKIVMILVFVWLSIILAHIIFLSYKKFIERLKEKKEKKEGEDTYAE